jgi:ribosomal protein S18 acetylase RimI-like enzyme
MAPERSVTIRQATPDDAEAIADVWLASFKATLPFPPAHPDEDVRRWIRDEVAPRPETFVAVQGDGTIVGFMSLRNADLDHLYVLPDRHGRGIGSRFVELAKQRRPGGLWLFTFQVNRRARAFYERRGFTVERLGDGTSNEERQPDVRYVWKPAGAAAAELATRGPEAVPD